MISARTERIALGVLLAGLLIATSACGLVSELRLTRGAPALRVAQAPTRESIPAATAATPASSELRPVSSVDVVTPAPAAQPAQVPPQTSAPDVDRAVNDDPRAVIDWLLKRSSIR